MEPKVAANLRPQRGPNSTAQAKTGTPGAGLGKKIIKGPQACRAVTHCRPSNVLRPVGPSKLCCTIVDPGLPAAAGRGELGLGYRVRPPLGLMRVQPIATKLPMFLPLRLCVWP